MNRDSPKPSAEVSSPSLSTDQNSPGIPNGWSIEVDGQRIGLPREDAWRLMAASGRGVKFVVGEQHAGAFHDITFDIWPELIVVRAVSPEHADNESLKRWTEWTGLPVPGSHEIWKAVWHRVGLTPPNEITDERITNELKPALLAKHRRDTQDNQRWQAELDIANKMAEAATKLSSPAKKPKRGGQRKYDFKLKKRIREAWATGTYKRLAELDKPLGLPPGTAKKVHDTDRKKPRATD